MIMIETPWNDNMVAKAYGIFSGLLQMEYKDLRGKEIYCIIAMGDNRRGIRFSVEYFGGHFHLRGNFHASLVEYAHPETIIAGTLAHELGHVAKRRKDKMMLIFARFNLYHPLHGNREALVRLSEMRADEEAIRRGLGEELALSREYWEDIGIDHTFYYSSSEIRALMKQLSP